MSPAQDQALKTKTRYFEEWSLNVGLKEYKHSWDIIFFMTTYGDILVTMDIASAKSDINGSCFWRIIV